MAASPASPFKFLEPYTLDDEHLFFGREVETKILLADILTTRVVVLFAKTGTGKTSLINAGVRPVLHRRGYRTFFLRSGRDPIASARAEIERELGAPLARGETFARQLGILAAEQPAVLFFDQFEEFFIYVARGAPELAREFVTQLATIVEGDEEAEEHEDGDVHLVFSMREEFLAEMEIFRDQIPTIFGADSNLRLRWFTAEQAGDAITLPLAAAPFETTAEPELVTRIVGELSEIGRSIPGAATETPIEPAQLQMVCDTAWRAHANGGLTLDLYLGLARPGARGSIAAQILDQRLVEEFETLEREEELELAYRLLPELHTARGTKWVRELNELARAVECDPRTLRGLLERLARSGLVDVVSREDAEFVELVHDYLAEPERIETLRRALRSIWPMRQLRLAMAAFGGQGETLPAPDELARVLERVDELRLTKAEGEVLLQWALSDVSTDVAGAIPALARSGADVWRVLAQRLEHGDEDEAVRVLDALARLDRPEARAVLEEALGGDLRTAERVVGVLGATSTVQAVTLLERALRRPELRDAAQEALAVLAGSWSSPAVADDAAAVLAGSLEAEPPGSAAEAVLRGLAGSRHAAVAARARPLLELLRRPGPEPPPRPPAPEPLPRIAPRPRGGSIRGARAESHQRDLFSLMSQGRVVPFLGPGVNALEPGGWEGQRPPTTGELASYLSERYAYPGADPRDLARVAQYVDLFLGRGPLHDTLHDLFVRDSIPSHVHDVLASMPAWLRASGSSPHLLMVTTNYDDRLERALDRMREPYDLLTYVADGEMAGGFVHVSPDGQISPVESGYRGASLSDRSVVVKLYGGVLHADPELESYLVSEDDVIDSLAGEGLMARLPPLVLASLQRGSLLFLGYGLGEWASRALLRRVRDIRRRSVRSWAVVRDPSPLDELLWEARGTSILDVDLADFMTSVEQRGTEDSA